MREGWKSLPLGDVSTIVNGGTPKTRVSEYWGGDLLWITPAEMGGLSTPYLSNSRRKITDEGLRHSSASLVPPHSVILSTRAPIGHVIINTEAMSFNQGCRGLVPCENLNYKYLYYFLYGNSELLNDLGNGTTFKELAASKLKQVKIPLPPLNEQKRIVAILDEAFAGIEKAVANAEKNLANARELFESRLNSLLSHHDADWTETCLSDCATLISTGPFGSLLHKSDYVTEGVPLVNPINIAGAEILPDDNKRISAETKGRLRAYILREGDIVIARRGEIGRCAVVTEKQNGWVCGTGCFFIRPKPEVNPYFLARMIKSYKYRKALEKQSTGTTMKNLSNKALSDLKIKLPAKQEQDMIVVKLEELSEHSRNLESIYQQKSTALTELKQPLLQKAFSGELTANANNKRKEAAA